MEKLKNFIYDKNDIVIALVIIVLATFIITGRIDAIMSYPAVMLSQAEAEAKAAAAQEAENLKPTDAPGTDTTGTDTTDPGSTGTDPAVTPPDTGAVTPDNGGGTTAPTTPTTPTAPITPPATGTKVTITIPSGSIGNDIAGILVSNGLIVQKSDFFNAVAIAGVETKLKAGTFKIPSNATPSEIVMILAK
jgi:hypothetical protein